MSIGNFIVNGQGIKSTDVLHVNGVAITQVNCNGHIVWLKKGHTQTPPPPHDEPMQNDELEAEEKS